MNWGYKIMIVYGVFVAGILLLVFQSSKQNIELVTTDYYAKELVYQQQIDAAKHTAALPSPVRIENDLNKVIVRFPEIFTGKEITGDVKLYYPADESKDQLKRFTSNNNEVLLPIGKNNKGMHYVLLHFRCEGKEYYVEQKLIL